MSLFEAVNAAIPKAVEHAREARAVASMAMRSIEIDLSDLGLPAEMARLDDLALATAHVYERFVPYADEGWEWVDFPGSREFEGWVVSPSGRTLAAARLLSRRVTSDDDEAVSRPSHGVSAYRTRQLTSRPWTAEPGSKRWRSLT
jgi:hypothetical protein